MNSVQEKEFVLNHIKKLFKCSTCSNLQKNEVLQCCNGHTFCVPCYRKIIINAKAYYRIPRCLLCRVQISRYYVTDKGSIKNIFSVFSAECEFCQNNISKSSMETHKLKECEMRVTSCRHKFLGCNWIGPFCKLSEHELECKILGILAENGVRIFCGIFQCFQIDDE